MANPVTDNITNWNPDADTTDTNLPVSVTHMEAGAPGDISGEIRRVKSEMRTLAINLSWERWKGLTNLVGTQPIAFTYISGQSFSVNDNFLSALRPTAVVGRRLKALLAGQTIFGTLISATFSAPNTNIAVLWDGGAALDATLSEVIFGPEPRSIFDPVIDVQPSQAAISNVTLEQSLYAVNIRRNYLGTVGKIESRIDARFGLISGANATIKGYLAGVSGPSVAIVNSNTSTVGLTICPVYVTLSANNQTGQQVMQLECMLTASQSNFAPPFAAIPGAALATNLAAAFSFSGDSTTDLLMQINVLFSGADPANQFDHFGARTILLK